jgi:hypothetical protein
MYPFFLQLKQRPFSINSDASKVGTHLALALVFPVFPKLLDNLFLPQLSGLCPLLSNWLTGVIKRLTMALLTFVIWISSFKSIIDVLGCSRLDLAVWGLEKKALDPFFNELCCYVFACNIARTSFQFSRHFSCFNNLRLIIVIGKIYRN